MLCGTSCRFLGTLARRDDDLLEALGILPSCPAASNRSTRRRDRTVERGGDSDADRGSLEAVSAPTRAQWSSRRSKLHGSSHEEIPLIAFFLLRSSRSWAQVPSAWLLAPCSKPHTRGSLCLLLERGVAYRPLRFGVTGNHERPPSLCCDLRCDHPVRFPSRQLIDRSISVGRISASKAKRSRQSPKLALKGSSSLAKCFQYPTPEA